MDTRTLSRIKYMHSYITQTHKYDDKTHRGSGVRWGVGCVSGGRVVVKLISTIQLSSSPSSASCSSVPFHLYAVSILSYQVCPAQVNPEGWGLVTDCMKCQHSFIFPLHWGITTNILGLPPNKHFSHRLTVIAKLWGCGNIARSPISSQTFRRGCKQIKLAGSETSSIAELTGIMAQNM